MGFYVTDEQVDALEARKKEPHKGPHFRGIESGRRFYDPTTGRFVTADPLGFADGRNRYLYAQATPLIVTDPSGLLAWSIGANAVAWADANFNLVNDDWRYMPTMNYLDWPGGGDYLPAAIQNMLFAPIWNLAAGTLNPMIDISIYRSDSEYAAYLFVGMHPEIAMQTEYTMQAMGPLVETTVGRVGQWLSGRGTPEPAANAAESAIYVSRGGTVNATKVEELRQAMISGTYRFTAAEGRIGGYVDSAGNYMIGEGHHRIQAAIQAGETYVQQLIQNGVWTRVDKFPTTPMSMPPVH